MTLHLASQMQGLKAQRTQATLEKTKQASHTGRELAACQTLLQAKVSENAALGLNSVFLLPRALLGRRRNL